MHFIVGVASETIKRIACAKCLRVLRSQWRRVELKTFKSYGVDEILWFKTEEKDGRTHVNFIWCKVCARNEEGVKKHTKLRGNTKMSAILNITKACNSEYLIV